jgi:uncharacterized SAM-binding protein YcdF (DUF218 family)
MTGFSFLLAKILAALILPPAGPLLAAALLVLVALTAKSRLGKQVSGGAAVFLIVALLILSLPIVGNELLGSLDRFPPINEHELKRAQAIVILSGGVHRDAPEYNGDTVDRFSLERLRYGARLARRTNLPVLVTGGAPFGGTAEGELMRQSLAEDFGVQVRWIETESRNTMENASLSAPLLKKAGISNIALVSQSWHLTRAVPLFEQQGFHVTAAPTAFAKEPHSLAKALLPDDGSKSRIALREYLGLLFYRLTTQ